MQHLISCRGSVKLAQNKGAPGMLPLGKNAKCLPLFQAWSNWPQCYKHLPGLYWGGHGWTPENKAHLGGDISVMVWSVEGAEELLVQAREFLPGAPHQTNTCEIWGNTAEVMIVLGCMWADLKPQPRTEEKNLVFCMWLASWAAFHFWCQQLLLPCGVGEQVTVQQEATNSL